MVSLRLRPNYFIFMGYLKTEGVDERSSEPPESPLDLPLDKTSHLSTKIHWLMKNFNGEKRNIFPALNPTSFVFIPLINVKMPTIVSI